MEIKAAFFVIKTNQTVTLNSCFICVKSHKINLSVLVLKVFRHDNFHSCPAN
jgi:hypothetical protein